MASELETKDRQSILAVLLAEPFRGLSVEDIVWRLGSQDYPPGVIEVRAGLDWLVRQALAFEDEEASLPPRYHASAGARKEP